MHKQINMRGFFAGIAGVLALCIGQIGAAADTVRYYRYENDENITVIDDHVPPRFARKGYSVINDLGRVLEVIPRELTEAELRSRDPAALEHRLSAEAAERQRRDDQALLIRYSNAADIKAAKLRKINEIKIRIQVIKGSIANFKTQVEQRAQEAADLEQKGEVAPPVLLDGITGLRSQIADAERSIGQLDVERSKAEARFEYDVRRFQELRPENAKANDNK